MLEWILFSMLAHSVLLLSLWSPDSANTKQPVEVVLTSPISKKSEKSSPSKIQRKYANSHAPLIGKNKLNTTDYALRLKSLIDPICYDMINDHSPGFTSVYSIKVLININSYGTVLKTTITQPSGNLEFDKVALSCIKVAGQFPDHPPDVAVTDGIEWSLRNGL